MIRVFILVFILLRSSYSFASNACENLSQFSCQPGANNDGTGSVTLPIDLSNKKLARVYDEVAKPIMLKSLMDSPDFKTQALEAIGQGMKECQTDNTSKCNETLAQGLIDLITMQTLIGDHVDQIDFDKMYNLTKGDSFREAAKQGLSEVGKKYSLDSKTRKITNEIIPAIKKSLQKKISELVLDTNTKATLSKRIQEIQFAGADCGMFNEDSFDPATTLDELYIYDGINVADKGLILCKGLLTEGYSEFAITHTIARELARSIDPCGLAQGENGSALSYSQSKDIKTFYTKYPLSDLVTCLRNSNSADAQIDSDLSKETSPIEVACYHDQMGQAFTDWFAAEATADYINKKYPNFSSENWQKGISNIFRPYCDVEMGDETEGAALTSHAGLEKRFDRILAVHPLIKEKMGCTSISKVHYCDGQPDVGTAATKRPPTRPIRTQGVHQ